jgi:hypothetical protein
VSAVVQRLGGQFEVRDDRHDRQTGCVAIPPAAARAVKGDVP